MKRVYLVLVFALLGADPKPSGGTITGKVAAVSNGKVVQRDDVFVYLVEVGKRRRRGALPGAGKQFAIRQKREEFVPKVLVIPVGADVAFPNDDATDHNVFSPTDPTFDLGRYGTDKRGRVQRFEDVDEFDIYCNIHSKMRAKVKVVDTPYIQPVVGGKFTFTNIPPGRYRVVAWMKNSKEVFEEVEVVAGATKQLSAELHPQVVRRSGCHDRKDGSPYPARYNPCPPDD